MATVRDSSGVQRASGLIVHQWLTDWDKVEFESTALRSKPLPHFYLFSISAADLRSLCGVHRRTAENATPRSKVTGVERRLDQERVAQIQEYIRYGYPWSDLSARKRVSGDYQDLRKPGWLPTAIVVNVLQKGETRDGKSVHEDDLVSVTQLGAMVAELVFPRAFSRPAWSPQSLAPIEVIDGQHRLWAFTDGRPSRDFEIPVVAFHGLDLSWQAYLFWTINIRPKKINASLAFDMYPLLRTEDWLEKGDDLAVYRETRAQELTGTLWAHPESPWHNRINMLGETGLGQPMVTQAAWIRSLTSTYVRKWDGQRGIVGGLFGSRIGATRQVLEWGRQQQAAFLIAVGQTLAEQIRKKSPPWAVALRESAGRKTFSKDNDPAFVGLHSLLATDQGIRGLLHVTNDIVFRLARKYEKFDWDVGASTSAEDEKAVTDALKSLQSHPVHQLLEQIASVLADYDWRTSSALNLEPDLQSIKASFRGSSGYRLLRLALLQHLADATGDVAYAAREIIESLARE